MQIFTPRGLKIRVDVEYGFALMKRLYPKVDAFTVLKTTEGLDLLPSAVTFIAVILAFLFNLDASSIAVISFLSFFLSYMITFWGLYFIPGLINLGTIYSYISGYGIALVIITILGYATTGIDGIIAFFIARVIAGILCYIIDTTNGIKMNKTTGIAMMNSERSFFNSYRIHADKLGVTTSISVDDTEMQEDNWIDCFKDFANKYPEAVRRFR